MTLVQVISYDGKDQWEENRKDKNELIRKDSNDLPRPAASLNERATVDYIISRGFVQPSPIRK